MGGPIPKMSNKMFWFVSWRTSVAAVVPTQIGSVPTQDYRNGDFSARGGRSESVYQHAVRHTSFPQSRINPAIPTALDLTAPLPNSARPDAELR
ncbi:MAG: hypothetical protein R2724_00875 [Bryobacterales bacterium]